MYRINCQIFTKIIAVLVLICSILISTVAGGDDKVVIKLATMVPEGSPWHDILLEMKSKWKEASKGQVELRIYPGGTAGDEGAMVRKMRIGQLQGALITNSGLSGVSPAINALVIPMAADSYEKLDLVRQSLGEKMVTHYEEKGFVILNWGDAGWVRFFVKTADPSLESVQKAKMFVWAGDDRMVDIWKQAGFNIVPLAATDMLPALQTGMVNAYPTTAVMALSSQWFAFTPYMVDLPWAPLVGATVVTKKSWDKIPETLKPELQRIASEAGVKLINEIRQLEEKAIQEMQKRGLTIITPDENQREKWYRMLVSTWPKLRGDIVPDVWFDAAVEAINGNTEESDSGYTKNEKQ